MTNNLAASTHTFLPSRDLYRKAVRRDLIVSGTLLVLITGSQIVAALLRVAVTGDYWNYAVVGLYVALATAGIGFSMYFYRSVLANSRVQLGATSLEVTNWFGRTRTVAYADVGTVIQTLVRLPAVTLPMLFLLDRDGKRLVTLYGTLWPTDTMIAVGSATGVTPTVFPAAVSYRELRKRYPRAISWARANPILLAVIIAGSVFLVVIVVMVVLFSMLLTTVAG